MAEAISFDGRIAVVAGGASGIGLAAARRLSTRGARVAVWDLRTSPAAEKFLDVTVDVSDEASIATGLARTHEALGAPDILVTSAGITGPTAPLAEHPVTDWRRLVDVHLVGTFLCCRAVLPEMIARDYGRIVTVSSVAGKEGNINASGYSAAKAGIIGLTKSLGKELASTGIRVNCIAPGLIETPLMAQLPQEQIARSLASIPMRRFGTVEEAAALIAWLASDECSFNSGAVFDLSGGRATY